MRKRSIKKRFIISIAVVLVALASASVAIGAWQMVIPKPGSFRWYSVPRGPIVSFHSEEEAAKDLAAYILTYSMYVKRECGAWITDFYDNDGQYPEYPHRYRYDEIYLGKRRSIPFVGHEKMGTAFLHTHPESTWGFSNSDKRTFQILQCNGYLVSKNTEMLKYDYRIKRVIKLGVINPAQLTDEHIAEIESRIIIAY